MPGRKVFSSSRAWAWALDSRTLFKVTTEDEMRRRRGMIQLHTLQDAEKNQVYKNAQTTSSNQRGLFRLTALACIAREIRVSLCAVHFAYTLPLGPVPQQINVPKNRTDETLAKGQTPQPTRDAYCKPACIVQRIAADLGFVQVLPILLRSCADWKDAVRTVRLVCSIARPPGTANV